MSDKGFRPYSISCQNEPQQNDDSYPTMLLPASQEAVVGKDLRSLLDSNGFSDVKLIGYDHNWDDAETYPIQLVCIAANYTLIYRSHILQMDQAHSAFTGVAFHCYSGDVSEQESFTSSYPHKEVYVTECTGTVGTDWWSNIKWNMDHLFIGSTNYDSRMVLLWNLAAHSDGTPRLPGSRSCEGGCRPVVSIDGDSWYLNEEC